MAAWIGVRNRRCGLTLAFRKLPGNIPRNYCLLSMFMYNPIDLA